MASSSSRSRAATGSLSLPLGYRFRPTEEELVSHYLKLKLQGMDSQGSDVNLIPELDLCKYEPWDLPAKSLIKLDDEECYFFSRLDRYNNSNRAKRSTEKGYWKITSKERLIRDRADAVIAKKRILTFYLGRVRNDQKTNWVMHEYYIPKTIPEQRNFVLCHLKKNPNGSTGIGLLRANAHSHNDYNGLQSGANESEDDIAAFENSFIVDPDEDIHNISNYGLQLASGANESEDDFTEFLNEVLIVPDEDIYEETMQTTLLNEYSLPESPIRVYAQGGGVSSDTDTEVVRVEELQSSSGPPVSSSQYVMLRNQFSRQNASSVKVAPEKPMMPLIYPTYERTSRHQSLPRSVNILQDVSSEDDVAEISCLEDDCLDLLTDEYSRKESTHTMIAQCSFPAEGVSQRKGKQAAERRAAVNFPHQKQSITKFDKDRKVVAQGNNAEMGMKGTLQCGTTASNDWKGSIIFWETSPLSPKPNPPSFYVCNIVLGIILFIVVVREVVLYGNWC